MASLWLRQALVVARYEAPRTLLRGRALPLYLLALLPVIVTLLMVIVSRLIAEARQLDNFEGTALVYANVFQFILRLVIFAGSVWIFMNLFRGEVLDRSLHYYFLAPIRREVLVAGKFLAGCLASAILFVGSTVVSMFVLHLNHGAQGVRHLLVGAGAPQLWTYAGIALLGCVGYGAVFLVVGLVLRNPIVPALVVWIVEWANPFLPSLMKKISVVFYLNSLVPVRLDEGPFALVADPVSAWLAVPGLFLFAAALLAFAGYRIRRMEIAYGLE